MSEIFGSTTTTPMNPDAFSGGGGNVNLDNYYTKDEIDNLECVKSVTATNENKSTRVSSPDGNTYIQINNTGLVAFRSGGLDSQNVFKVNNARISSVREPRDYSDAATKGYVDSIVGDIETLLGGI